MTRSDIAQAAALRAAGMTWKAVARQLGHPDHKRLSDRVRPHVPHQSHSESVVMANLRFPRSHHDVLRREAAAFGVTVAARLREIVRRHVAANAAEERMQ